MKRTERHHLKEDEMAHGLSWLVQFIGKYRREILTVAGALAFAAVVFAGLLMVRAHGPERPEPGRRRGRRPGRPRRSRNRRSWPTSRSWPRRAAPPVRQPRAGPVLGERGDWAKAESFAGRIPERARTSSITRPRTSRRRSPWGGRTSTRPSPSTRRPSMRNRRSTHRCPPLPARREPRAQRRDEGGSRPLQEAPGRAHPVLFRL